MPRSPISPATSAFRNKRLSVIAEDGSNAPGQARNQRNKPSTSPSPVQSQSQLQNTSAASVQAHHRPESRQWSDKPPRHSAEQSPPGYEHWNTDARPSRWSMFMGNVRNNRQFTRRGGWRRLLIFAAIILLVIIALAVGLGVGLTRNNSSSSSSSTSGGSSSSGGTSSSGGNSTGAFPEGSYSIPVYSSVVATNCTSQSSTWRCYPYSTYAQTGASTSSEATYFWIISSDDTSNPPQSFNISTSNNPFQDIFSNVPLTLQNAGTSEEHYAFETTLVKTVLPTSSIAPNGETSKCFYNSTILRGELYTQKPKMNVTTPAAGQASSGTDVPSAAESSWQAWPYAVNVTEIAAGGQNVPNCYAETPQGLGSLIGGFTALAADEQCVCGYQNFGL